MDSSTTSGFPNLQFLSRVPSKDKSIAGVISFCFIVYAFTENIKLRRYERAFKNVSKPTQEPSKLPLYSSFVQIANLALPTFKCLEFAGSCLFVLLFALSSYLRVRVSRANGATVQSMLNGDATERTVNFTRCILMRCAIEMSVSMCNGFIEYLRQWLISSYRVRLSKLFQRRFYDHLVYYQATVLDDRLEEADVVISTYCAEFAEHFAELPYYFLLPAFECIASLIALVRQAGFRPACIICPFALLSVYTLQKLAPAFGLIHTIQTKKEGDYWRLLHNNIENGESIALHSAGRFTRERLDKKLESLKSTLNHFALAKGNFHFLEIAFGLILSTAAHVLTFSDTMRSKEPRTYDKVALEVHYIQDLNISLRHLVLNFKEISHLREFTTKLKYFDDTLRDIAGGTFIRSLGHCADNNVKMVYSPLHYTNIETISHDPNASSFPLLEFKDICLRTPGNQILLNDLSLTIQSDDDWVIIGENGCGKTSLLRMMAGLWKPSSGTLLIDSSVLLLFAPQHTYMVPQCTLLEQICFPQRAPELSSTLLEQIHEAIRLAGAQTVLEVIGGENSPYTGFHSDCQEDTYEWTSLSGGQKQRLSMARVFYHSLTCDRSSVTPVAILDEATSMMDETEDEVLFNLRSLNVRMISVTHREAIKGHHTKLLRIKQGGMWEVEVMTRAPIARRM